MQQKRLRAGSKGVKPLWGRTDDAFVSNFQLWPNLL